MILRLILLLGLFINLHCADIGNPPGGLRINDDNEQVNIVDNANGADEKVQAEGANLNKAYIGSFGSKIGGKTKNKHLCSKNCYYKRPTFKFMVLFEKSVSREVSNKFVKFVIKHGDYVCFGGYHAGKNGNNHCMPFATTMNEKEFQKLIDRANRSIN